MPDVGFDLDQAKVFRVTNLNAKGEGSLAEALSAEGPRIVVFEVGGVIDLERKKLHIKNPEIVVAGQTAPKPGITIIRGSLTILASQTVVQHLRIRPGDAGQAKRSGWSPDGVTTDGTPTQVWIDHCSATWAIDEQISATSSTEAGAGAASRVTIRNCIIAEGLNDSSHPKGPHSKGTLVFGGIREVAIVGNLFANTSSEILSSKQVPPVLW